MRILGIESVILCSVSLAAEQRGKGLDKETLFCSWQNRGIREKKRANLLVFTIRQGSGSKIEKERAIPLVFKDTEGPRQGESKEKRAILTTEARKSMIDENEE